jgi:predicted RNA-binding Zn-ribbon protein involved in translation (DUF1610 family)
LNLNPIRTLVVFPFRPRRVALDHASTPLWKVYLVHVVGLVVLGIGLAGFDTWAAGQPGANGPGVLHVITHDREAAFASVCVLVGGELTFALVAACMMAWAGRDESLRSTWGFALRVSWFYVSSLWWVCAVFLGGIAVGTSLTVPHWLETTLVHMWVAALSAVIVGSIVGYLRALSSRGTADTVPDDDTPTCERCGYDLSRTDVEGRCPECGTTVEQSMSLREPAFSRSHRRSAADWVDTVEPNRAVGRSERFYRAMAVNGLTREATTRLAIVLGVIAVASGGTFLGTMTARDMATGPFGIAVVVLVMVGMPMGFVAFMLVSMVGSLVGWRASRRVGLNRLSAGLLVSVSMSPAICAWFVVAVAILVVIVTGSGTFSAPIWFFVWLGANGVTAVIYASAALHRMTFVQYSNS